MQHRDISHAEHEELTLEREVFLEAEKKAENGASVSISESYVDNGYSSRKAAEVFFSHDEMHESIYLPEEFGLEEQQRVFDVAAAALDGDHPEQMFIAYGRAQKEIAKIRQELVDRATAERERQVQEIKEAQETSYADTREVAGYTVSVAWNEDIGPYGSYVIDVPDIKFNYVIDQKLNPRSKQEVTPAFAVGARPEIAQLLFESLCALLQKREDNNAEEHIGPVTQEQAAERRNWVYHDVERMDRLNKMHGSPEGLWDKNAEFLDTTYVEKVEANGIQVSIGWNNYLEMFTVHFPDSRKDPKVKELFGGFEDIYIEIGTSTAEAKQVAEYVAQRTAMADSIVEVYDATREFVSGLR